MPTKSPKKAGEKGTLSTSKSEISLPSTQPVPFGIPPHPSVSIQGLKDHLLLSGKKKFTDKEFGDFICLLSKAEPSEEIYIQNEQYFNENQCISCSFLRPSS